MEEKTEFLMDTLKSVNSVSNLDAYVQAIDGKYPMDFSSYIDAIIKAKNMTPADLQKKSYIERSYFYKILKGTKNPGRDKILCIAIAAEMTLEETQRALEITNEGILYSKNTRDSVIIYAINHSMDIAGTNELLVKYNEPELE